MSQQQQQQQQFSSNRGTTTTNRNCCGAFKKVSHQQQYRMELEAAEKYYQIANDFYHDAKKRHKIAQQEWIQAQTHLLLVKEKREIAKKFVLATQNRLQVISLDDDDEEDEEQDEQDKDEMDIDKKMSGNVVASTIINNGGVAVSTAATGAALQETITLEDSSIEDDYVLLPMTSAKGSNNNNNENGDNYDCSDSDDDEGSIYTPDAEDEENPSPQIITPNKKKRKQGENGDDAVVVVAAPASLASSSPPPPSDGNNDDWFADMEYFLLNVPHGRTRTKLAIVTETNTRRVMEQVRLLASGNGITYKHWSTGTSFGRGRQYVIDKNTIRTINFTKWGIDARQFENKHGEDKGHGWLLKHPITKLGLYQNYLLQKK